MTLWPSHRDFGSKSANLTCRNIRVLPLTVQAPFLPKETHFVLRIAAHKTDDDCLLFPALEAINASQLDAREHLLEQL